MRSKGNGLLTGPALAVDGNAGHLLGVSGRKPGEPTDVAGLSSDGIDAADDGIINSSRVNVIALEDSTKCVHSQINRVDPGE